MSTPSSMSSGWLAAAFIAGVKRRANIPTSDEAWTTADFLAYANDAMVSYIAPLLRRLSEEFFVTDLDTTVTSGTAAYRISNRALGEALRDVQYTVSGGYQSMLRRSPQELSGSQSSGTFPVFYLRDDKVVLVPTPANSTDVLRIKAMLRPNKVVASDRVFNVESVGSGTAVLGRIDGDTSGDDAADFFNSNASSGRVDIIRPLPGFRSIVIDTVATFSTVTATFTSGTSITDLLTVGDYVCIAGEAPMPQLPAELHPLLAQEVACAVLRASGDAAGLGMAEKERDRLEGIAIGLLSPRTENQPRYVSNKHGVGVNIRRRVF
jgi:hypothetical protein